jgi:2-methylcitrate dehydratase PrpD
LDGHVFIDSFDPRKVTDPHYGKMADRVFVHMDREVTSPSALGPVTVDITLRDGNRFSETVQEFKGHPNNPMSIDECRQKFMKCADYAVRPFPQDRLELIVDKIMSLENLRDAGDMVRMMVP